MSPIASTPRPSCDAAGPIICGLLSSPDVLLCNVEDWRAPSEARADATCPGMTYDQGSRQVTLRLGGQEFTSKSLSSAHVPSGFVFLPSRVFCYFLRGPLRNPQESIPLKRDCPVNVA